MSFKLLKKQSEDKTRLDKLVQTLDKPKYENDNSYWGLTRDKEGNGTAIIRFLPTSEKDDNLTIPIVEKWSHRFKGKTGKWYYENCLSTLSQPDPVNDYNTKLWNTGDEQLQSFVRQFSKRKLAYIANILVVSDPGNPDNNGKVFKFSFGKRIYEKIIAAMKGNPAVKKKGFDIFDYWKGANFIIDSKLVDGQINYNDSYFDAPSHIHYENEEPLSDKQIEEEIYQKQYNLSDELSPDKFKSYDELKKRLDIVLGVDSSEQKASSTATEKKLSPEKTKETKKVSKPVVEDEEDEDTEEESESVESDEIDKIFADLDV